jgi:subtilase family serine protease
MSKTSKRIALSGIALCSASLLAPATLCAQTSTMVRPPIVTSRAKGRSMAAPFLKLGPQAIPTGVAGPNYGLFTCQIVNLSPTETCYDPYEIRHAYKIDTLINAGFSGSGKTIVIIDAYQSPNIVQQLNTYDTFYGLPSLNGLGGPVNPNLGTFTQIAPDGLTPFVPGDPNIASWAEEISLDVLWAHAIAPGANIVLDLAKSSDDPDILSATAYAVDHNFGDVISQSFGENESCVDPSLLSQEHQLFADATSKNITLFASSGDLGAGQPTCDNSAIVQAVSSPASDPLVTAVGGTELHAADYCLTADGCDPNSNPAPGTYEGEIAWNESAFGAAGGGFSVLYGEPSFQKRAIPAGTQRGVPDVAYNAAVLHGVLTYLNIPGIPVGYYLFGGTSAGSPQWAAIMAIADQLSGDNMGFINKALYRIGQLQMPFSVFLNDVTTGNNSFADVPGFDAGPGWDPTTGFGSPIADHLVPLLSAFNFVGDAKAAIAQSAQAYSRPSLSEQPSVPGHIKPD